MATIGDVNMYEATLIIRGCVEGKPPWRWLQ